MPPSTNLDQAIRTSSVIDDLSLAAFDDLLWSVNAAEQNPWVASTGRASRAALAPQAEDQQTPASSRQAVSDTTETADKDSIFSDVLQTASSAKLLSLQDPPDLQAPSAYDGPPSTADRQQSSSETHSGQALLSGPSETSVQMQDRQPTKRRVGRPPKFGAEHSAAHLPRPERAQVMRRIANRESARRVRKRKQDDMDDLNLKAEQAEQKQAAMESHVAAVDERYNELFSLFMEVVSQRHTAESAVEALQTENSLLKQELAALRLPQPGGYLQEHTNIPAICWPSRKPFHGTEAQSFVQKIFHKALIA